MTHSWMNYSKNIFTLLAAVALLGVSACGDEADDDASCDGVTCEQPENTCEGKTAVTYSGAGVCSAATGTCNYQAVETRTICGSDEICINAACIPAGTDACGGACANTPAKSCDGNIAITYSGAGTCDPLDQSCDFSEVKETTNCEDTDQSCRLGECVTVSEICEDVTCNPLDAACEGNNIVRYTGPGTCSDSDGTCDYSNVRTVTACGTDEVCAQGECVETDVDLCEDVSCDAPDDTCDGNSVVSYSGAGTCDDTDGTCDFSAVETTTACGTDEICAQGECVDEDADLCEDVTCDAPDDTCDGDSVVSYTGAGTCDDTDGTCDFSAVETTTPCDTGETCQDGACIEETADLCENVTCDAPDDTCDGDSVVSYTGAGTCDDTDGTCDFSGVETTTPCDTGETCQDGACVPPTVDNSVNAGDLVITEYMANPSNVGDGDGEYFEVYNKTSRTLHVDGLTVADDGSDSFEITNTSGDPIEIAPGAYFVFGTNADTATNGGVTVDYEYGGSMSLANSGDEIFIAKEYGTSTEVEIARVAYGSGTDFPSVTGGASAQLGAENDLASVDANDGTLWCDSRDPIDTSDTNSDLGTPGAANVDCAIASVTATIQALQDDSSTDHPTPGTPVVIENVTITAVDEEDAWAQNPAGGPYSGIYLNVATTDVSAINVGDVVNLEGTYTEAYGVTTLDSPTITVQSSAAPLMPEPVLSDVFADDATAEPWEGVLISVKKPAVTNQNPDAPDEYGEFRIDATLRVATQLFDYPTEVGAPTNCDTFTQVSGVVHYTFGQYKLLPREAADFPAPDALALSTDDAVSVSASGITPEAICVDEGTEITWTSSGTAIDLNESDPVNGDALTSPGFSGTAPAIGDFTHTFNDAGITHYMGENTTDSTSVGTGRVIVLEQP